MNRFRLLCFSCGGLAELVTFVGQGVEMMKIAYYRVIISSTDRLSGLAIDQNNPLQSGVVILQQ